MANLKSSKKDIKRNRKNRTANLAVRTSLKTVVKKARAAISSGDSGKMAEATKAIQKSMDKAAQRGIIHPKQAARRKSRIAAAAAKAQKS